MRTAEDVVQPDRAPGAVGTGCVGRASNIAGPHVTRHVPGLERRGLVERVVDPEDQRARLITLTAKGRRVTGRYLDVVYGWFSAALTDWAAKDRRDLTRLLGRLVDDLTAQLAAEVTTERG